MTLPTREDEIMEMARKLMRERTGDFYVDIGPAENILKSDNNGCWVQAYIWVPFAGTKFDKERKA